jgi:hypothetical protein
MGFCFGDVETSSSSTSQLGCTESYQREISYKRKSLVSFMAPLPSFQGRFLPYPLQFIIHNHSPNLLCITFVSSCIARLTHFFNVVIRHTRSTRTLAFTQASSFYKLSIPSAYVILLWCVFLKPCTKLTLHCNNRSGHQEREHTESLLLLQRHLRNWPRGHAVSMRSELLVAHEKLGQLPPLTVYVVPV